jgi:hypothetical protein
MELNVMQQIAGDLERARKPAIAIEFLFEPQKILATQTPFTEVWLQIMKHGVIPRLEKASVRRRLRASLRASEGSIWKKVAQSGARRLAP